MNHQTLEILGWLGSTALAICGLPQAYQSWKEKKTVGISSSFLYLWLLGEILTLIYVIPKWHWPLLFNYVGNLIFISIILYYKYYPKN